MNKINPVYIRSKVLENTEISRGVFRLKAEGKFSTKPGQFFMLRAWGREPLLSRPISICDADDAGVTFLYQVTGRGTELISRVKTGEYIELTGPLGNGFDICSIKGKVAVVTGGIGIAPMVYLAKSLINCSTDVYSGFRNSEFCIEEIQNYADKVFITTEDGGAGIKGYVTDIFKPELYDLALCCGPEIMMNKVIGMCREKDVPVFVSMEKHMACGIGACLACTCKTKLGNKRVCKDGPVFSGSDIVI